MTWVDRFLQWLQNLFTPGVVPPVSPPPPGPVVPPAPPPGPPAVPPASPPPPPPVPAGQDNWLGGKNYPFPDGFILTRAPGGAQPIGIPWKQVTRWEPSFTAAAHEFGDAFGPLLTACMSVVESRSNQFKSGAMTDIVSNVVRSPSEPPALGIMQVVLAYHAATLPSADGLTADGNIRIASKLMTQWIRSEGSWEAAITNKYHPGTDPYSKVTTDEYIRAVREMILEVKAGWPKPPAPVTPKTNPFPRPHIDDISNAAEAAKYGLSRDEAAILASYTFGPRPQSPRYMVHHIQDGTTPGSLDWWIYGYNSGVKVQASANYMANRDGTLLRVIPENAGPWTNGDVCNPTGQSAGLRALGGNPNIHTLTVEAEGKPFDAYTQPQLGALLWLFAEWMLVYKLPLSHLLPHSSINQCSRQNCPGQQHYDIVRSNLAAKGFV